jgi:dihydrofolate reductase
VAKLVYALNVSLDGYVDHMAMGAPGPQLFRHFIEEVRNTAGSIYGRVMYETMRYWDEDQADWTPELHEYAEVWRRQPKWVVSRTLTSVGPNATLIAGNVEAAVREVKARIGGQVEVAGPKLAGSLTDLGLIDEYQLYMRPWAAVAPRGQRADRRGHHPAELRSGLRPAASGKSRVFPTHANCSQLFRRV